MSDTPQYATDGAIDGVSDSPGYAADMGLVPAEIPNTASHASFVSAIKERTRTLLDGCGTPQDLIDLFGAALAEEVDAILLKFAAGQRKHGGDIRDRNMMAELQQEIRDALVYTVVARIQGTRPPDATY